MCGRNVQSVFTRRRRWQRDVSDRRQAQPPAHTVMERVQVTMRAMCGCRAASCSNSSAVPLLTRVIGCHRTVPSSPPLRTAGGAERTFEAQKGEESGKEDGRGENDHHNTNNRSSCGKRTDGSHLQPDAGSMICVGEPGVNTSANRANSA